MAPGKVWYGYFRHINTGIDEKAQHMISSELNKYQAHQKTSDNGTLNALHVLASLAVGDITGFI